MIIDRLAEFCDATTVTTATGTHAIGSNLNLGSAVKDFGQGQTPFLVITVDTAFTSGGSATVAFQLVSDAQDPPAADATETVHWRSHPFAVATLVAGYSFGVAMPFGDKHYEQYLGIEAIVATASLTAGKINAFLTFDQHGWTPYPEGTN